MKKLTPAQLRKHNRKVAAGELKQGLSDRSVRVVTQGLLAGGQVSAETVTGIETTLRQSRRVSAKYNRAHVHTGAEPQDDHAPKTVPKDDKPVLREMAKAAAEDAKPGFALTEHKAREVQSKALERAEGGSAHSTFGDTRGGSNKDDSENVRQSTHEGSIPNTGPRFKQTEHSAGAKVAAAKYWDDVYAELAWHDFQSAHPTAAGDIEKIEQHTANYLGGIADFAKALESWLKKQRPKAREKLRGRFGEARRIWLEFLKQWRQTHPDVRHAENSRDHWRQTGIQLIYPEVAVPPQHDSATPPKSSPFPVEVYKANGVKAVQHFKTWGAAQLRRREYRNGEFTLSLLDEATFTTYPHKRTISLTWNFGLLKQKSLLDTA